MDFMKILKSLEVFVFEIIAWLVFYPLTMWKVLTRPAHMMKYADDELDDSPEDYYSDMLSPPIFLAITIGLAHLLELGMHVETHLPGALDTEQNLLGYRILVFSIFPLVMSLRLLRKRHVKLDRKTLKPPFFSQSFVIAPYAFLLGIAPLLTAEYMGPGMQSLLVMLGIIALATVWYLILQARWFALELRISVARGAWHAILAFVQGVVLTAIIAALMSAF